MIDAPSHRIEIEVTGKYPHGASHSCSVAISGNGGIAHMIQCFNAALHAAGFSSKVKVDE